MNKVLITGGAGYLGSVLTEVLLEKGYQVTVLDNLIYKQTSVAPFTYHSRFKFVFGDVTDESVLKPLVESHDVIIPLACLVGAPLCDLYQEEAIHVNQKSIKNLTNILSKQQIVIFPVSNSGYGIGKKNELCTETSKLNPISLYGKTKVQAEEIIMSRENSIALRLATVFGMSPRMRVDLLVNNFVYQSLLTKNLKIFEGNFKRNYVHIEDVANVFIFMINNFNKHKNNVFNFGLEEANLSKLELANIIKTYINDLIIQESEFDKDPDKRDYIVSNKKILSTGFNFKKSLDNGILELISGLLDKKTIISKNV